jgi:hypothetical protein
VERPSRQDGEDQPVQMPFELFGVHT